MSSASGGPRGDPEHDFLLDQLELSVAAYNAAAANYNYWLDTHRDRRDYHDLNRLYLVSNADLRAVSDGDSARVEALIERLNEARAEVAALRDDDRRLDPFPINENAATLVVRWHREIVALLAEA